MRKPPALGVWLLIVMFLAGGFILGRITALQPQAQAEDFTVPQIVEQIRKSEGEAMDACYIHFWRADTGEYLGREWVPMGMCEEGGK